MELSEVFSPGQIELLGLIWRVEQKLDRRRAYWRKYCRDNREKINQISRGIYARKHRDSLWREKKLSWSRSKEAKAYRANRARQRRREDLQFKLRSNLSRGVRQRLSRGSGKSCSSLGLLGCSVQDLKVHLERQFKPGMSWENYGYRGWHIDHIRPCASFALRDPEQQKACFHYTNLQPLWWHENLAKGSRC